MKIESTDVSIDHRYFMRFEGRQFLFCCTVCEFTTHEHMQVIEHYGLHELKAEEVSDGYIQRSFFDL